jgi:hypothetical protein
MPWGKLQERATYKGFQLDNYLDETVFHCKCGSSFENGSYTRPEDLDTWIKAHEPHVAKGSL